MDYEYTADERATYACLDKDGIPFLCGRDEWEQWLEREGERSQIQFDRIDGWEIETRFQGISVALDGPPLFWEVSFYNPVSTPDAYRFGTKEAALEFHASVAKRIMSGELLWDRGDAEWWKE